MDHRSASKLPRACLAVLGLAWLALLPATPAAAQNCNSLYAVRIAERTGAPDCQSVIAFNRCPAGTTADQCADATWANPPAPSGGNGPFRARFVYGPSNVRCVDGTRPLIYVDKAVDAQGNDLYTNDWLFMTGGEGGPCSGIDPGLGCYGKYTLFPREDRDGLSSMHPDSQRPRRNRRYRGILDPQPVPNPARANPFAAFNRVYLERCTTGVSRDYEDVDLIYHDPNTGQTTTSTLWPAQARVYHHGDLLWQAIFDQLGTAQGRDLGGGGNAYVNGPDLPPIADATTVLLAAHSDAGKWLILSGDHLESRIQALNPGINVNVGLAIDGHAVPSLQHEMSRNDPGSWPTMFVAPHANNFGYLLPDDGDGVADEGFGNDHWLSTTAPNNAAYRLIEGMNAVLDASCVAYHGGGRPHECLESMHVAFNHLSTPVFFRQDQRDGVFVGKRAQFSLEGQAGYYEFPRAEFHRRVFDQFIDYVNNHDTDAEEPFLTPKAIVAPNRGGQRSHTSFVHRGNSTRLRIRLCDNGVQLAKLNMVTVLHDWLMNGTQRTIIENATGADIPTELTPTQSWIRRGACP